MEVLLPLKNDTYNSDTRTKLLITSGTNDTVFLKLDDHDREVSVSLKDLFNVLKIMAD